MKIDELITELAISADEIEHNGWEDAATLMDKAAETIRLLWEIAQDSSNAKYKRQIDEWRGEDGKLC